MIQIQQPYPMAPGDKLDFEWDFTDWLLAGGRQIQSFEVEPGAHLSVDKSGFEGGIAWATLVVGDRAPVGVLTEAVGIIQTQDVRHRRAIRLLLQIRSDQ